ncbi:penicillin acylase family protein [Haliscomenobacter sp.]|uniref:penicillin acylase family protein n=1 Tax=Haliscomenobacter sp. TaxID=2717303 RepID=UPI003BAC47C4
MRFLTLGLLTLFSVGLLWVLDTHNPFGSPVPAMGRLLNPVTGFWANAEAQLGFPDQQLQLSGLNNPVKLVFDERRVPHIFADNTEDAFFAQGYITAYNRLWQMDMSTRKVSGRLAEVVGERALASDLLQRRKGIVKAAENMLKAWENSPEDSKALHAYVAGVNAYISALKPAQYPLEYKLMGFKPEPWSALRSVLFIKAMAEDLCARNEDLAATNTRTILGEERFKDLFPEYNPKQSPIIPSEVKWNFAPVKPQPRVEVAESILSGLFPDQNIPQPFEGIGSNNWAVGAQKTLNGNPILCNDPHLGLTLPSIWFEIQMQCPDFNAYGVSLPGLPGIAIGFNDNVAWGETNVGQDVLDWYAIKWADQEKQSYHFDGGTRQVEQREEIIQVKGRKEPVKIQVKYTHWGPLVFGDSTNSPYYSLAMHWLPSEGPDKRDHYELASFIRLMKAKNYADYDAALTGYDAPAQNFVFAARDGDIALKVNGKFPIKRKEQGRFIQDGSLSNNAWQGYIPREQIPQVRNPSRGFVASANQHSTDETYPYYYNGGFDDYRGRFINRSLEAMDSITVKDLMALQNNPHSLQAEEALPLLLKLLPRDQLKESEKAVLKKLEKWDGNYQYQKTEPAIFQAWFDSTYVMSFDEIIRWRDSVEVLNVESWRYLDLLDKTPNHAIFDWQKTKKTETAADLVLSAFQKVCKDLSKTPAQTWRTLNNASVNHLARIPAFSHTNLPISGYAQAPNAIRNGHGPSWRMVVELGKDEVKAWGVYPGGSSGNPGSPFYDHMVDQWAKGEYNELFFMRNAQDTRKAQKSVWSFSPKGR